MWAESSGRGVVVVVVVEEVLGLCVEKSKEGLDDLCAGEEAEEAVVDLLGLTNAAGRVDGLDPMGEEAEEEEDEEREGMAEVDEVDLDVLRDGGLLFGAEDEIGFAFVAGLTVAGVVAELTMRADAG